MAMDSGGGGSKTGRKVTPRRPTPGLTPQAPRGAYTPPRAAPRTPTPRPGTKPRPPATKTPATGFGGKSGGGGSWAQPDKNPPKATQPRGSKAPKPATYSKPPVGGGGGGGGAPMVTGSSATGGGGKVTGGGYKPSTTSIQSMLDKAKRSVQAEDLPMLNELQRQLDANKNLYNKQTGEITAKGKRVESDLRILFERLQNRTQNLRNDTTKTFQGLKANTQGLYDQLGASTAQNFDKSIASTTEELQRLGLGSQVGNATADMNLDKGFLTGLAKNDGANAVTGLGMQQQGFDNLMTLMQGNAGVEGASNIAAAKLDQQKTLADLLFDYNQQRTGLEGKRGDIIATQGQRTRELAEALADKADARSREDQQIAFEQMIASERLGMDKQQLAASLAPQEASYADQLDVALKQAQLDKALGGGATGAKLTPEQRARQILEERLGNETSQSKTNITDMWNIINTLRLGTYAGDHDGNPNTPSLSSSQLGKFDINNPIMLQHLDYALRQRFGNSNNMSTAMDIIRALMGK